MTAKLKIKKGDKVVITTGKDKGKKGVVEKVFPALSRVVVEGANLAVRHKKPTAQSAGGLVNIAASIHISNVALVDPKSGVATKVGFKVLDNGSKVRVAKKSGEIVE